jgi:hypothetical protein
MCVGGNGARNVVVNQSTHSSKDDLVFVELPLRSAIAHCEGPRLSSFSVSAVIDVPQDLGQEWSPFREMIGQIQPPCVPARITWRRPHPAVGPAE